MLSAYGVVQSRKIPHLLCNLPLQLPHLAEDCNMTLQELFGAHSNYPTIDVRSTAKRTGIQSVLSASGEQCPSLLQNAQDDTASIIRDPFERIIKTVDIHGCVT